jgi:EpsI family protein
MKDLSRALLLSAAMAGASVLAVAMQPRDHLADHHARERLAQLVPEQFGAWSVDRSIVPIPPSPDLQRVLDQTYDETLARTYRRADGRRVMLSLAYGRNQHKGMNTHRPEVCYPGQGFKLMTGTDDGRIGFQGRSIPVKRLVAALGARNEPITYWLMVGQQITEFGSRQRWTTIQHGLRGEVPDGVLVRVSSIDSDNGAAFLLQERFVQELLESLSTEQRARLLGAAP